MDYGADHADRAGHHRFGRTHDGQYPEWDEAHPIHLFGHSLGGCTIRYLQHLLAIQCFPGHATSARWILSITTLNTPHLGTTTAYILGEREDTAPDVRRLSPGKYVPCQVAAARAVGPAMLSNLPHRAGAGMPRLAPACSPN